MNHRDLPFGRCLCDRFSRTFRVRRKQSARRHPAMTRVVETPDGLARIETIVTPPKEGTSMAGLSVPVRLARVGYTVLSSIFVACVLTGVLRRNGSVRGGLVLAPDLRTLPGAAASVDGTHCFRRPDVLGTQATASRAPGLDRRAVRLRRRRCTGGSPAPGERVADPLVEPSHCQAGVGCRGRTEKAVIPS